MTVYTIGHSTRTIAEFVALLQQVAVETVVGVRAFARSRDACAAARSCIPVAKPT